MTKLYFPNLFLILNAIYTIVKRKVSMIQNSMKKKLRSMYNIVTGQILNSESLTL